MVGRDQIRRHRFDAGKRVQNDGEPAYRTRVIDRKADRRCFKCDKLGHIAHFCRVERYKCFICNDGSHMVDQCPNRGGNQPKNK